MLLRVDPRRDLTRLRQAAGPASRGGLLAMDASRGDDAVEVQLDLPGVAADEIEVTVDKGDLTVTARRERSLAEGDVVVAAERRHGEVTRVLHLGDGLDGAGLVASYDAGVLSLRIPVAEQAKPRRISVAVGDALAVDAGDEASSER